MTTPREWMNRVRSFGSKAKGDADLDAEMAVHLEMAIDENVSRGMTDEEARRQAMIQFGGVQQAREKQRDARGLPWLDVLLHDLRYTLRTLRRDRAFTIVAVLILGLGIGANIAVFSVVNTILLRPLPFAHPEQLVRIPGNGVGGESEKTYTTDAVQEYRERNRSFEKVSGYFAFTGPDDVKLTGQGVPRPATGILIANDFFETLGVQPVAGRLFTPAEYLSHGPRAVLLSYPFWTRQYHGDPGMVGRVIDIDRLPFTVTGVLPETFDFGSVFSPGSKVDMFLPFAMADFQMDGNTLALVARLKPGVTLAQAQTEANILFPKLDFDRKHAENKSGYTARLFDLKDFVSGMLRRSLIVLWCAVGMILLIVCVNLANLLLARAAARSKEFAMRSALGASRGRIIGQLLTESLVLSGAGAMLGLGVAFAMTGYLAHQGSIALPLLSSVRIDAPVLGWTVLMAMVVGVLFGITPALKLSGHNIQEKLKDSGHGTSAGRSRERLKEGLVVTEVALACLLLVGAGLLLRSFLRVLDVDLGFQPSRAAAISVDYDDGNNADKRSAIWQEVLRKTAAIPGVESVGITDNLPMSTNRSWGLQVKGQAGRNDRTSGAFVYIVSPGYVKTMGMRLVEGHDFSWSDTSKSEGVVIINQTLAKAAWPNEDPIGRVAQTAGNRDVRVIGVIADVRETSVETLAGGQMYLSAAQFGPEGAQLVVRTKLPPAVLAGSVMSVLRAMNAGQPATEFKPIEMLVDRAVSPRRFFVLMVMVFAGFGMVLAAVGIYGVISYAVTQQTKEIGIRMALGATMGRVQAGVILKTLWLTLGGIVVGTVAALIAAEAMAALLYGTSAKDPETFVTVVVMLLVVAMVAGYLPARRASRIDPMVALRSA